MVGTLLSKWRDVKLTLPSNHAHVLDITRVLATVEFALQCCELESLLFVAHAPKGDVLLADSQTLGSYGSVKLTSRRDSCEPPAPFRVAPRRLSRAS